LPTAEEQADAAFDDLLLTSLVAGPQSQATAETTLEKAREQAQAQSEDWTAAKSKGAFWELQQLFGALSGGAHITRHKTALCDAVRRSAQLLITSQLLINSDHNSAQHTAFSVHYSWSCSSANSRWRRLSSSESLGRTGRSGGEPEPSRLRFPPTGVPSPPLGASRRLAAAAAAAAASEGGEPDTRSRRASGDTSMTEPKGEGRDKGLRGALRE